MELLYIFRILYRKKWIILGFTILAVAVAFFFTRNQPKYYKSVAQFATGFTDVEILKVADQTFSLQQIDVKFNNAIADITSMKVLSLLSYQLMLHDLTKPAFRRPDSTMMAKNPSLKELDKAEVIRILNNKRDSIQVLNPGIPKEKQILNLLEIYRYDIGSIKKSLFVGRNQRTDYIDIIFRSGNPELSAFVVNTLCKEFQNYQDISRRERSRESVASMDSLVSRKKQDLDAKISAKSRFMTDSVSSSLNPELVGVNVLSQISQVEASLAVEEGNKRDLDYQIEQLDKQLASGGTSQNTNRGDNTLYLSLRTQYNDLLREYTNGGSTDAEMKARLDDLQQKMRNAAPSGTSSNDQGTPQTILQERRNNLEGQRRSANFKIGNYRSKLGELNSKLRSASPESSASLDRLDKDIETAQLEYTAAKDRQNTAMNIAEGFGLNFRQTLFGQPALSPEPSKRIMLLGLSGLSAFVLTSLLFVFLAYIDQSIKTPSQFQRQTDLKLLGTVNYINMKQNSLGNQVTQIDAADDAKRDNAFRELLRKLRYEIESSGKRVILFTSTEPQQGKTTLTQALAFSLSLGKKRVLILDTNFCNNDLTANNNAQPTLEQFSGNGKFDIKQVEALISKTPVTDVDMIGCKGGDYTPSEILPKNHLLNYLPDLLKEYDFIFMEAAPLNGFTDTKELVPYAEGVIAIFSATAELKQVDKDSIKFLHQLNGKFLGAILNKVGKSDINL